MPTNKKKIAEQILILLGNIGAASNTELSDLYETIGQLANQGIKASFFGETLAAGERIPDGCVIGTYENIAVASYKTDYSKIELPAIPVSLPLTMGVWSIRGTDDPLGKAAFIPVPAGQFAMYTKEDLLSNILNQVGYEVKGKTVIFTKDITAMAPAISHVDVELIVLDMSKYDEYELLPLTADQEAAIVQQAFKLHSAQLPTDKSVDSTNDSAK